MGVRFPNLMTTRSTVEDFGGIDPDEIRDIRKFTQDNFRAAVLNYEDISNRRHPKRIRVGAITNVLHKASGRRMEVKDYKRGYNPKLRTSLDSNIK